ncbi:MAG: hypothetical protein MZV49_04810 [Rhodopseudomonas palustris]|nr:hypothetical protein [Rhodopseudomonas palustris]
MRPIVIAVLLYVLINLGIWWTRLSQYPSSALAIDVLFSTVLIYFTGAHSSRLFFIYIVVIVFGSFFVRREKSI